MLSGDKGQRAPQTTLALRDMTVEQLDAELNRLLQQRQEATKGMWRWPVPLRNLYRRAILRSDRRQMPLTAYIFGFSLSVFVPSLSGLLDWSAQAERLYGIDCAIEDLMDEVRRRRDAA